VIVQGAQARPAALLAENAESFTARFASSSLLAYSGE
jgi:phosphotransferase system HPr-like phosphotransfer protein